MSRANNIHAWEGRGFSPAIKNAGRSPHRTAIGESLSRAKSRDGGRQAAATFRSFSNA